MLPRGCGVSIELRALALALLARWRPPGNCVIPPESRDAVARRIVTDYVGQARDFQHFVEDAAAGELRASHRVPLAILTPARRELYEGIESREMPLLAGTNRNGAKHVWAQHGPQARHEKAWARLQWSDWLYAQRMVDELAPIREPGGRWRLASPGWLTVGRRSVGLVLALERFGDALTPVTFFRVER